MSVPDCYKNQGMCNEAVDNYPDALEFVYECFMTQGMCDKVVNTQSSTIQFVPELYKTQKIYMIKLLINLFLYSFMFLIGMKLKKYVTELFLMIPFQ